MNLYRILPRHLDCPYSCTVAVCGLLVVAFYLSLSIPAKNVGFLSDDAVYLLMADIYSPWRDALQPVHGYLVLHNRFPPLYSFVLALVGVDSGNAALASMITVAIWCLGFVLVGMWLYQETRSRLLALAIPLLLATSPVVILVAQELWSESLYFLLSFLFLYVLSAANKQSAALTILCGLLVCLVLLTRSIGVALLGAFFIHLMLERPRGWTTSLLLAVLPYTIWLGLQQLNSSTEGYYSEFMNSIRIIGIDGYLDLLLVRIYGYWQAWRWLFTLELAPGLSLVSRTVLILTLTLTWVGFGIRLYNKKTDAFYLLLYTLILIVWPYTDLYFQTRFHIPLMPLYLFYSFIGLNLLLARINYKRHAQIIGMLLLLSVVTPVSTQIVNRAFTSVAAHLEPYSRNRDWLLAENPVAGQKILAQQHRTVQLLLEISKEIPEKECVYAIQAPIVMLYSKRITGVYPASASTDWATFVEAPACRYMLAINMTDHRGVFPPLFPCQQLQKNTSYTQRRYYINENGNDELHMCLIEKVF